MYFVLLEYYTNNDQSTEIYIIIQIHTLKKNTSSTKIFLVNIRSISKNFYELLVIGLYVELLYCHSAGLIKITS